MIVADASVVVDLLLGAGSEAADVVAARLHAHEPVCVPELIDAEVGQVLRRFVLRAEVEASAAQDMIRGLTGLPLQRYPNWPLLARAFAHRVNLTVYDALYVALAEALDATLLTGDAAMSRLPGSPVAVQLVATSA